MQNQEIPREINNEALCQFLVYAYTIDNQTMFNGIKELPPGHKLVYSCAEKKMQITPYWNLDFKENNFGEKENLEILKKILTKAIDERQISDAPIGALLSGGLDSSLMPATGTPEPGGLFWNETIKIIKIAAQSSKIVGGDINELSPIKGFDSYNFLVAKLAYKIFSYSFEFKKF